VKLKIKRVEEHCCYDLNVDTSEDARKRFQFSDFGEFGVLKN
jgi:hypothetical protein